MSTWAADNVNKRLVSELIPYDRNPKIHPDSQIKQLSDSIREWGWTMPILIDENDQVLAGHGRLFAAKELKLKVIINVMIKKIGLITIKINIYFTLLILQN